MNKLLQDLNIDETYTKPIKRIKIFNKVKDNIYHKKGYNYEADLLELPKTKEGYKYLLVVVDLFTDNFDIEPLKNKDSNTTLNAIISIFKRKYIKIPKASLTTDGGSEFKSVFDVYLKDNNIDHKTTIPNRHKQLGNVENLNKQMGRLFNGYMNTKEKETNKPYNEWTDIVNIIRNKYNDIRKRKNEKKEYKEPNFNLEAHAKYKSGDMVYYKLDYPKNALNHNQPTANFRVGDFRWSPEPRKIIQVLFYPGTPSYRYLLNDIPNASYSEEELKPAINEKQPKFLVKSLIGKKKVKGTIYFLVWWKGYKKEDASWEAKDELIRDGLEYMINDFESKI
jgi:hypothetical protein